ncbi:hypothetical protein PV726_32545 [Streptomyces europaeiscabiei]|uniref:hypothetical protein n=1 Tax=Streptomyces europaeiscabiei TaxID=146819 RepID=UPI0029B01D41|nr:hypothetical protein [Streptomyces europaeiscabiei]MDX3694988.1 hypothetical protein [Streptomyces europaeiscabiei]
MQNRAATKPTAPTYTVWHRVSIGGEWVGLAFQHLSKERADERAGALVATGSKNVMVLAESNGGADTPTRWQMLEMNTFGVFIDTPQIKASITKARAAEMDVSARADLRVLVTAANPTTRPDEIDRAVRRLATPQD